MGRVALDVPERLLIALEVSPAEMGEELRMAAAVKLFELERLSSGAAAGLARVPKPVFLSRLREYGVAAFRLDEGEPKRETPLS